MAQTSSVPLVLKEYIHTGSKENTSAEQVNFSEPPRRRPQVTGKKELQAKHKHKPNRETSSPTAQTHNSNTGYAKHGGGGGSCAGTSAKHTTVVGTSNSAAPHHRGQSSRDMSNKSALRRERSIDIIKKQTQRRHERSYREWHRVKEEARSEDQQLLLDKVALQQELIKSHDQLYQIHEQEKALKRKQKAQSKQNERKQKQEELVKIGKQSLSKDRRAARLKKEQTKEDEEAKEKDHGQEERGSKLTGGTPRRGIGGALLGRNPTDLSTHSSLASGPISHPHAGVYSRLDEAAEELEDQLPDSEEEYYKGASPTAYHRVYRRASLIDEALPEYHKHLYQMFGPEADYFLHPKMEDDADKKHTVVHVNPRIRQQAGMGGAKQLWNVLRNESRMKLRDADSRIEPELKFAYGAFVRQCLSRKQKPVKRNFYVQEDVPDMAVLMDQSTIYRVQNMNHQLELMYRASHMNEDRSLVIMHNNPPPDLNNLQGDESCDRYIPSWADHLSDSTTFSYKKWLKKQENSSDLSLNLDGVTDKKEESDREKDGEEEQEEEEEDIFLTKPSARNEDGGVKLPKLHFLTEEGARCKGLFSQRYDEARQKQGIPAQQHEYQLPDTGKQQPPAASGAGGAGAKGHRKGSRSAMAAVTSDTSTLLGDHKSTGSQTHTDRSSQRCQSDFGPHANVTVWAPLSLHAVGEYSPLVRAPGQGSYNQGRTPVWAAQPMVAR